MKRLKNFFLFFFLVRLSYKTKDTVQTLANLPIQFAAAPNPLSLDPLPSLAGVPAGAQVHPGHGVSRADGADPPRGGRLAAPAQGRLHLLLSHRPGDLHPAGRSACFSFPFKHFSHVEPWTYYHTFDKSPLMEFWTDKRWPLRPPLTRPARDRIRVLFSRAPHEILCCRLPACWGGGGYKDNGTLVYLQLPEDKVPPLARHLAIVLVRCGHSGSSGRLSVTELYLATIAACNCVQMQLIIVVQSATIMVGFVTGS